jgi:hypothetical protein
VNVQHGRAVHERLLSDAAAFLFEPFSSMLGERHPPRGWLGLILRLPHHRTGELEFGLVARVERAPQLAAHRGG